MSFTMIENEKEYAEGINRNEKAVVMLGATYCSPCKKFTPIFEKVAKGSEGIFFGKAEIDKSPSILNIVGVGSVPTIVFYSNGKEVHREIGAMSEENLINTINRVFEN